MPYENWLQCVRGAEIVGAVKDGAKKFHYKFSNGDQMVEEYTSQGVLQHRAWKHASLKKDDDWVVEVGILTPFKKRESAIGITESDRTPYVIPRVTKKQLIWNIHNLPYPLETYKISVNAEQKCIILSTTNKKYYKKLKVPELERADVVPAKEKISMSYHNNTLVISYPKPDEVIQMDKKVWEELQNVDVVNDEDMAGCQPS